MPLVKNISTGPRGAYLKGVYAEADPGEIIEADDYAPEWFEPVSDPLDHDGNGVRGGSLKGALSTRARSAKNSGAASAASGS